MKICQYLKPELIIPDLKAQSKEGVLAELAQQIAGHFPGMKAEEVLTQGVPAHPARHYPFPIPGWS